MVDDAFGHWLAGFIDGEGSFCIVPNRGGYSAKFQLKLRDDDGAILLEIALRTGMGRLVAEQRRTASRPNDNPATVWKVQSKGDCLALIRLLDRYPLRAKKARDYAIWREAVLEWNGMAPGRRRPAGGGLCHSDWAPMAALGAQLREARVYR
jgi:hypothetical protein